MVSEVGGKIDCPHMKMFQKSSENVQIFKADLTNLIENDFVFLYLKSFLNIFLALKLVIIKISVRPRD